MNSNKTHIEAQKCHCESQLAPIHIYLIGRCNPPKGYNLPASVELRPEFVEGITYPLGIGHRTKNTLLAMMRS
jgi:hypothetical protein